MNLNALRTYFENELLGYYSNEEMLSFFYLLTERFLKLSRVDFALNVEMKVEGSGYDAIQDAIKRLQLYEPIQYILGDTEFYGLTFKVNSDVLIPRPETEELVDCIIKEAPKDKPLTILDIGTGSGCIAVALAKNLNNATVIAIDISKKALKIAAKNAKLNNVEVEFLEADILDHSTILQNTFCDIIVSNPPYVRTSEKEVMKPNVLNHEPHLALFVDDKDALLYYKKIVAFTIDHLKTRGFLYFEINENLGRSMERLLKKEGFDQINLQQDLSGKDRIIRGIKIK